MQIEASGFLLPFRLSLQSPEMKRVGKGRGGSGSSAAPPAQEGTGALLRQGHGLHASFTALWDRTKTPAQAPESLEPSAGAAKTQQPQLTGHPRAGN